MSPTLNASSRIMYQTAQQMGITCTLMGDQDTILMEYQGRQWYTKGSRTSVQSSVGKSIADNKALTKLVLDHFNLPTAKSVAIFSTDDLELLTSLQFPIVMKPLNLRHGTGVKVGITSIEEARQLYESQRFPKVICEETLHGTEYRIICINYKFVAAAFRKPAHVVGDGRQTIQQLIDEKNQHPWRGEGHVNNLTLITADDSVIQFLESQGFSLKSAPASGQEVLLRQTANLSTGGEAWDVTDDVSPDNRQLFEQIARACDLNVIGIDIMCQNLTQPITEQPQAGVIEVNASPGLRMHHYPLNGQPRQVAQFILEFVINQLGKL